MICNAGIAKKTKQFQALLDELGALTPIQRAALLSALKSNGSVGDVVTLLETEFARAPACGHCGSATFCRWGIATGMKRYMCKACDRTFNALTGMLLAHLHKREKWLDYARAIRRWSDAQKGRRRRASGNVVPLAASLPRVIEKGEGEEAVRHCRSRRDLHSQVCQRLARFGGPGATETRRKAQQNGHVSGRLRHSSDRPRPQWCHH